MNSTTRLFGQTADSNPFAKSPSDILSPAGKGVPTHADTRIDRISRLYAELAAGAPAASSNPPSEAASEESLPRLPRPEEQLRTKTWFYGDAAEFRVGMYDRLPDLSGKRKLEGGRRLGQAQARFDQPLVTVVTAVFNNVETLQRCIDSVRNQTYPHVEHVIVDGGSDEPTLAILRANLDHLGYVISEPDKGIYSAMNKGIAAARGDFVCLLNSDDHYDPEYVAKAVTKAAETDGEPGIVYTDFMDGTNHLVAQPIGQGILFGNLNINHCSFLVARDVYDQVGPYNEHFRIVSDVIWIRRAFLTGVAFQLCPEPLFRFSPGGLSSGASEAHRKLMIGEAGQSYRLMFPDLQQAEAEEIYLFRFRKNATPAIDRIAERHANDPALLEALQGYVTHCFRDRANFQLNETEIAEHFPNYIRLADRLGVDRSAFQVAFKGTTLAKVLADLEPILARSKTSAQKTILHFVSVFSAPSETFIYDVVNRLEAEEDLDNFVLFERAELSQERPYAKAMRVAWQWYPEIVSGQIYRFIVDRLQPDVVIGHFALNEWKWASRTKGLGIHIPTISMCHGIDVFSLRDNPEYSKYILDTFAKRSDTAFTAVSAYLREEMIANGISRDRIHLTHNTVNDRFFAHRKTSGFYDGTRTLKLLSVGRLIDWKGHRYLIEALAQFRETATHDCHLTIVYGNGGELLPALRDLVEKLDLSANVEFLPFVDFSQKPDFYAEFDVFVHPSTYSAGPVAKSETFGVAVLEAIMAGLPVITTDAGGLPEVIGEQNPFGQIVPHADSAALANALTGMWQDGESFSDNRRYAEDRLARFSASAQTTLLRGLMDEVSRPSYRVAMFSTSTLQGAGYAAYRLHRGLRDTRTPSHMFTTVRDHARDPDVTPITHPSGNNAGWRKLQMSPKPGLTIFTVNDDHLANEDLLRMVEPYDAISLQWHARFLSLENIAALTHSNKPVLMTIRDMMPITGGCHYFHGCDKWQSSCHGCPQLPEAIADYPATALAMKRLCFNFDNLTLVTISNHTRQILEKAPVFRDCRIETIPNSIETDVFYPYDRVARRKEFGLPLDKKIIGYVPSFSSEVKGYREIIKALTLLSKEKLGFEPYVMMVGNATPATDAIPLPKKALGYINDNVKLARAYSCADVVVVPSLEETFSNTTAEAIACGVPVVGFKTGAIPDLVIDGKTGYTYEVGDHEGLARGIRKVLEGPRMRDTCRAHAVETLSFMTQARRYENLVSELVEAKHRCT